MGKGKEMFIFPGRLMNRDLLIELGFFIVGMLRKI